MRALADGDAAGFASLCVYPIVRPYPLKDIEDSLSMVDYFPILVDAPLREKMKKGKVGDWGKLRMERMEHGRRPPYLV